MLRQLSSQFILSLIKSMWFRVWMPFARIGCKAALLLKPVSLYMFFISVKQMLNCFLAQTRIYIYISKNDGFFIYKILCSGGIILLRCSRIFLVFKNIGNSSNFWLLNKIVHFLSRSGWQQLSVACYVHTSVVAIFLHVIQ